MDYYESVVRDYLRANRALFVNTEYCIQISLGRKLKKSEHWYCDAVVADFRTQSILLCEISYSVQLAALIKRLNTWNDNWDGIRAALARDSGLPKEWPVRPWLFVPTKYVPTLVTGLSRIGNGSGQPGQHFVRDNSTGGGNYQKRPGTGGEHDTTGQGPAESVRPWQDGRRLCFHS